MKNSRKLFNKKGDGLSSVVIAIVFIIIVLLMVPAFRGMQHDNTNATRAISNSNNSFINNALTDAGQGATYNLDADPWEVTEATNVD